MVAVNCFEGAKRFRPDAVRTALDLNDEVPVVLCDARHRSSSRDVLVTLVEYAIKLISDSQVMAPR